MAKCYNHYGNAKRYEKVFGNSNNHAGAVFDPRRMFERRDHNANDTLGAHCHGSSFPYYS
jgi:hypothetical protein